MYYTGYGGALDCGPHLQKVRGGCIGTAVRHECLVTQAM